MATLTPQSPWNPRLGRSAMLATMIPFSMALAPLAGFLAGRWVGRWVGFEKAGSVIGLLVGLVAGAREAILIIRRLQQEQKSEQDKSGPGVDPD